MLLAGALALAGLAVPAAASAPVATAAVSAQASAAAGLLNRWARAYDEPVRSSPTQTYDVLVGLAAAGEDSSPAFPGRAWSLLDALEDRVAAGRVTTVDDLGRSAHLATVYDQDPRAFGGRDLVAALAAHLPAPAATDPGWLRSTAGGTTTVTTRVQARGALALARAGDVALATRTASGLRSAQLASGAFPVSRGSTAADLGATVDAVEALVTEGSSSSAVATAAAWLVAQQQPDGGFGTADAGLVGRAADALGAAGSTPAAAAAAAHVEALQVVVADGVDPVHDGAFAPDAATRAALVGRTFDLTQHATLVDATAGGVLALDDASLATLAVDDPGTRPPVEGDDTSTTGACAGDEGVTVVVDNGYVNPPGRTTPTVRCALGTQVTGWAALENAGFGATSVPGFGGGALCQVDGVPAQGFPYCWTGDGYWSYWHAEPGLTWQYSNLGASNRFPPVGTVEGWRFVPLDGAGLPPRTGPTFEDGVDVTAPQVSGLDGPAGPVDGAAVTFTFRVDDLGAALTCRLDDDAWEPCDEPTSWDAASRAHVLEDVPDGLHRFHVRASDAWGNATEAHRDFVVGPAGVAAVTDVTVEVVGRTTARLRTRVYAGDSDQAVRLEYRPEARPADVRSTPVRTLAAGSTEGLTFDLAGLADGTRYEARVVTTGARGSVASAWGWFATPDSPFPAATFTVRAPALALAGRSFDVGAAGLEPGESYRVLLGGRQVAAGTAGPRGDVAARVVVPGAGVQAVRVVGTAADRAGSASVRVLTGRALPVRVRSATVRRGRAQVVVVRGLAPLEPVRVRVQGRLVSPRAAVAAANGTYRLRLTVGGRVGKRKVVVLGFDPARRGTARFTVTR